VTVWKWKCKVQQADLWGETIPYKVYRRHMLSWRENYSTHFLSVQRRRRQARKAVKTYYNVLLKILWGTLHWVVFWTELHKNKLLEVKVTTDFQRQRRKNFISVQCVNCSGRIVTTNFDIPASKFPIVVPGSKYMRYRKPSAMVLKISYFYDRKYHTI
jgi:hypothetical protein